MFVDFPQELILATAGAFVLGWLLSLISSKLGDRRRAKKRDPRDDRIRELEAEVRISRTNSEKAQEELEKVRESMAELEESVERRDNVITDQQAKLERTTTDLRESVAKTRELRAELTERATENVKSAVKLREVETELSVAQASTDMLATGVLDYSMVPDTEEEVEAEEDAKADVSQSAG